MQQKIDEAESRLAAASAVHDDSRHQEIARAGQEAKAAEERKVAEEARAKAEQARLAEEAAKKAPAESKPAVRTEPAKSQTPVNAKQTKQARATPMQGLWETITGGLRKSDRSKVKELKLQLAGTKDGLTVTYYAQSKLRPLVVILNGTMSKAQNLYADELERIFIRAGYHVMTFDSFFSKRFLLQTQLAAPGNLKAEAELSGKIIAAFLKQSDLREKVTDIAVVGMSYGGGVALQMALLDKAHELPFTLARIQAYSVPTSFKTAMHLLDEYEAQPYSYDTILPIVMKAYHSNEALPDDTTPEMLEKCIGRSFRLDLPETVEAVDRLYINRIKKARTYVLNTNYLGDPNAENMDREAEAQSVSFKELFEYWLMPYWQATSSISGSDLMDFGELSKIVPQLDDKVQIIIARNDPLNAPGSVDALEKIQTRAKLTVLPSGGHLGFLYTDAASDIALRIFPNALVAEEKTKQKK
jgi:predicted alpha/beta-fold hydrolase